MVSAQRHGSALIFSRPPNGHGNQFAGFGAAKSAETDFIAAAGNPALPRPRPVDDGGGGESAQSILLTAARRRGRTQKLDITLRPSGHIGRTSVA